MNNKSRKVSYKELETIKKNEFQKELELKVGVTEIQAKSISEAVIKSICDILLKKKSLLFTGIGTLAVSLKKERMGRNPKTKENYKIKEGYSVTLREGKTKTERYNKPEILKEIHKMVPNISFVKIKKSFEVFISLIKEVKNGKKRLEIRGLGVFYPSHYPERKARNPKSGETIIAPEKNIIKYSVSKNLKKKINNS